MIFKVSFNCCVIVPFSLWPQERSPVLVVCSSKQLLTWPQLLPSRMGDDVQASQGSSGEQGCEHS